MPISNYPIHTHIILLTDLEKLTMLSYTFSKRNLITLASLVSFSVAILLFTGCELIDPTKVENPTLTEESLLDNPAGTAAGIISGLRREYAIAVSTIATCSEAASDNYRNTASFASANLDDPWTIIAADISTGPAYENTQRLRAIADFALANVMTTDPAVASRDPLTNDEQRAEARFFKAIALIMLSENYSFFPLNVNQPFVSADTARTIAVRLLVEADSLSRQNQAKTTYRLALARVHRMRGDKVAARRSADSAIGLIADYAYFARYDRAFLGAANITQGIQAMIRTRTDHIFQPNPRLDFLDPKYTGDLGESPIATLKTEEAYLILAEIALSNNDTVTARQRMAQVAALVRNRLSLPSFQSPPPQSVTLRAVFSDPDLRANRPRLATAWVRADSFSAFVNRGGILSGGTTGTIILPRGGSPVDINAISNTRLHPDSILSGNLALPPILTTTRQRLTHTLYQLRQEIFFGEGRRSSDLGIRFPVSQRQLETRQLSLSEPGATVIVPPWIPRQQLILDSFQPQGTAAQTATAISLARDFNEVIASNIAFISPFSGW
jgi:hypothetical protein